MSEKKLKIDQEYVDLLERLHYEYNAYNNVEKSYIEDHRLDPDGSAIDCPIYDAYHAKTVASLKAYDEAKNKVVVKYNLANVNWQLDFKTGEITIG